MAINQLLQASQGVLQAGQGCAETTVVATADDARGDQGAHGPLTPHFARSEGLVEGIQRAIEAVLEPV